MKRELKRILIRAANAHAAGQLGKAEKLYQQVLRGDPDAADANFNLGLLLSSRQDFEEALPFLRRAIARQSNVGRYWRVYAESLIALGKVNEAIEALSIERSNGLSERLFRELLESIRLLELSGLIRDGSLVEALNVANAALVALPESAALTNILGMIFVAMGEYGRGAEIFRDALTIDPNFYQAMNNWGIVERELGNTENALDCFSACINIKSDYGDAYQNLGNLYFSSGDFQKAFVIYKLAIENCADGYDFYASAAQCLTHFRFSEQIYGSEQIIISLFENKNIINPDDIAGAAISILRFDPRVQAFLAIKNFEDIISVINIINELSCCDLLLKLMSVCSIPDVDIEKSLKEVRTFFLFNYSQIIETQQTLLFMQHLALQCYINEYIYEQSEDETNAIVVLEGLVQGHLLTGHSPDSKLVNCLGAYKAINFLKWDEKIKPAAGSEEVFRQQITEYQKLKKMHQNIPLLRQISDDVSIRVGQQYEENPYPRWSSIAMLGKEYTIEEMSSLLSLKVEDESVLGTAAPNVLIAGCGTGQQAISLAAGLANAQVLAIDLSSESIAYAKMKAQECEVKNIDFIQGDLLDVALLNRRFDIVQCGGVLHHMADPFHGWQVLTEALVPGGLMNICLYSSLARAGITRIREEAKRLGFGDSPAELKKYRQKMISNSGNYPDYIFSSFEFYYLSMYRDLFFHTQEKCFSLDEIGDCLNALNLHFCGFDIEDDVRRGFRAENKSREDEYDLSRWREFELNHPLTFIQMYQFWCQKS